MKNRLLLVISLLLIVILLLPACGSIVATTTAPTEPQPTQSPQPNTSSVPADTVAPTAAAEPVTITIWHGWQGEYYNNIQTIFAQYHTDHPNVTINLVEVPDLSDKIVTAASAGEGPDIVAFANDWIGRLSAADIIIPLDDYLDKAEYQATYLPTAVASQTYQGKIWGFPEAMETLTFIYNKNLISEDQLPKTTDELLTNAAQWQKDHPGQYYFVYNAKNDAYFSAPWFYGFGAFFVKEDGSVGLNTPEGIAAANFINKLRAVMPKEIDYGIADTLFKEGKAPITMNGPWYIADLEAAGIDYGMATIPVISTTGKPAVPFVGVKTLMVTSTSQHPEVAVDILKYFTSKDAQILLSTKNKTIPTNLAAAADSAVQALTTVANFSRQAALGTPMPSSPFMNALWDPVAKMLEAIWTGGATPEEAVKTAQTAAETNIEAMK